MELNIARRNGEAEIESFGDSGNLENLVKRFKVCWESLPDYYFVRGQRRQIGSVLQLSGTHEPSIEQPQPGCKQCQRVRRALEAIAHWIIPKERRDTDQDIAPYDQAIHHDPIRKCRPEVTLEIWIHHRSGLDRKVDGCELLLQEMTQRLRELGARERNWEAA